MEKTFLEKKIEEMACQSFQEKLDKVQSILRESTLYNLKVYTLKGEKMLLGDLFNSLELLKSFDSPFFDSVLDRYIEKETQKVLGKLSDIKHLFEENV